MAKWQLGDDPKWNDKGRRQSVQKSKAQREGKGARRTDVRAKRQLGQHFLNDEAAAQTIVDRLEGLGDGSIVEIGPGMGVITRGLLDRFGERLHCLELDRESVDYLRGRLPGLGERLHEADCLHFDLDTLPGGLSAMAGNLPYNISSQILFLVYDHRQSVQECVFMLQREVAERIAATPGGRERGILSVLLQAYYDISFVLTLPPEAFTPPPKVQSSVIYMRRNGVERLGCDEALFKRVVKASFSQRRKTLKNSLYAGLPAVQGKAGFDGLPYLGQRAETLSVEEFVALTNAVERVIGG